MHFWKLPPHSVNWQLSLQFWQKEQWLKGCKRSFGLPTYETFLSERFKGCLPAVLFSVLLSKKNIIVKQKKIIWCFLASFTDAVWLGFNVLASWYCLSHKDQFFRVKCAVGCRSFVVQVPFRTGLYVQLHTVIFFPSYLYGIQGETDLIY